MLYNTAESSGGKNLFASDSSAERSLNLWFTETSQRGCSVEEIEAVVGIFKKIILILVVVRPT